MAIVKSKKGRTIGLIFSVILMLSIVVMLIAVGESVKKNGPQVTPPPEETETVGEATFEEIYRAYKENELVADEAYQNNRYRVTGEIAGMTNDGLLNMTGGAMLTMQTKVGNTIVVYYAEFEKEQEEALKTVKVGDTITFIGTCLDAGNWTDCELVSE